jgi:integrase/recombinase XerD
VVSLHVRINLPDGKQVYGKPVFAGNKKLLAGCALIKGKRELHPEAVFYLRYVENGKRKWKGVGQDRANALAAKAQRRLLEDARRVGQPVAYDAQATALTPIALSGCLRKWRKVTWPNWRGSPSQRRYRPMERPLSCFIENVEPTIYLEDLSREQDIERYLTAIFGSGVSNRSIANRIGYVRTFLLQHGREGLLTATDKPKYAKRAPNAYNKVFLSRLFAACSDEERLTFQFFLGSGCREQEVSHACWPDVDLERRTLTVQEKEDLNWTLKDYEERTVPLPLSLVTAMRQRRLERPDDRFLFPTEAGEPDGHFLRKLKKLALRAGLNYGHCFNRNDESCKSHPVCSGVTLHRFRRTFATMHHENGRSAKTLQRWLGHADLETTMAYLAGVEDDTDEVRADVDGTFDF